MKLTNQMREAFLTCVMEDVPKVDYDQQITDTANGIARNFLPPKVRAIWDDKELRGFIGTNNIKAGEEWLKIPGSDFSGEMRVEMDRAIMPIHRLKIAQRVARNALKTKLGAVTKACTTTANLMEALPEFAQYIPVEEKKVRTLPMVTGVVMELIKAGWPKPGSMAAKTTTKKGAKK